MFSGVGCFWGLSQMFQWFSLAPWNLLIIIAIPWSISGQLIPCLHFHISFFPGMPLSLLPYEHRYVGLRLIRMTSLSLDHLPRPFFQMSCILDPERTQHACGEHITTPSWTTNCGSYVKARDTQLFAVVHCLVPLVSNVEIGINMQAIREGWKGTWVIFSWLSVIQFLSILSHAHRCFWPLGIL